MYVCARVCVHVCACVCVWEREGVPLCVTVCMRACVCVRVLVCVTERVCLCPIRNIAPGCQLFSSDATQLENPCHQDPPLAGPVCTFVRVDRCVHRRLLDLATRRTCLCSRKCKSVFGIKSLYVCV